MLGVGFGLWIWDTHFAVLALGLLMSTLLFIMNWHASYVLHYITRYGDNQKGRY